MAKYLFAYKGGGMPEGPLQSTLARGWHANSTPALMGLDTVSTTLDVGWAVRTAVKLSVVVSQTVMLLLLMVKPAPSSSAVVTATVLFGSGSYASSDAASSTATVMVES